MLSEDIETSKYKIQTSGTYDLSLLETEDTTIMAKQKMFDEFINDRTSNTEINPMEKWQYALQARIGMGFDFLPLVLITWRVSTSWSALQDKASCNLPLTCYFIGFAMLRLFNMMGYNYYVLQKFAKPKTSYRLDKVKFDLFYGVTLFPIQIVWIIWGDLMLFSSEASHCFENPNTASLVAILYVVMLIGSLFLLIAIIVGISLVFLYLTSKGKYYPKVWYRQLMKGMIVTNTLSREVFRKARMDQPRSCRVCNEVF